MAAAEPRFGSQRSFMRNPEERGGSLAGS